MDKCLFSVAPKCKSTGRDRLEVAKRQAAIRLSLKRRRKEANDESGGEGRKTRALKVGFNDLMANYLIETHSFQA